MKHLFFICILLVSQFSKTNAQHLSNMDFEAWLDNGTYSEPVTWNTSNKYISFVTSPSVSKSNDAKSGAAAAMIQPVEILDPATGVISTITGFLRNGNLSTVGGGTPFAVRPTHVQFWHKYKQMDTDASLFTMTLSKWNSVTQERDEIGHASIEIMSLTNIYTELNVPVIYFSTALPDTINIVFSVGTNPDPSYGTALFVDDISFTFATSIFENAKTSTSVYHNQENGILAIRHPGSANTQIELFDISGRLLKSEKLLSEHHELRVSELSTGIYIYRISDSLKGQSSSGKIAIK